MQRSRGRSFVHFFRVRKTLRNVVAPRASSQLHTRRQTEQIETQKKNRLTPSCPLLFFRSLLSIWMSRLPWQTFPRFRSRVYIFLLKLRRLADCNVIRICLMKNWYQSSDCIFIFWNSHTLSDCVCVDRGSILLHKGRFPHCCVLKKNNEIFCFVFLLVP